MYAGDINDVLFILMEIYPCSVTKCFQGFPRYTQRLVWKNIVYCVFENNPFYNFFTLICNFALLLRLQNIFCLRIGHNKGLCI